MQELINKWLPKAWGWMWAAIITLGSVALLIQTIQWLLSLIGVIV